MSRASTNAGGYRIQHRRTISPTPCPVVRCASADIQAIASGVGNIDTHISAEALFSLTDLCRLTPDEAVASLVRTATTITANATRAMTAQAPDSLASAAHRAGDRVS